MSEIVSRKVYRPIFVDLPRRRFVRLGKNEVLENRTLFKANQYVLWFNVWILSISFFPAMVTTYEQKHTSVDDMTFSVNIVQAL